MCRGCTSSARRGSPRAGRPLDAAAASTRERNGRSRCPTCRASGAAAGGCRRRCAARSAGAPRSASVDASDDLAKFVLAVPQARTYVRIRAGRTIRTAARLGGPDSNRDQLGPKPRVLPLDDPPKAARARPDTTMRAVSAPTVVIIAAGEGTRMRSKLPKVLHPLCGRPLILWPVTAALEAGAGKVVVVDNPKRRLEDRLPEDVEIAIQEQPKGTGDAVAAAGTHIDADATVVILSGDVPLISARGDQRPRRRARATATPPRRWPRWSSTTPASTAASSATSTATSRRSSRPRPRATRRPSSSRSARSTPGSTPSTAATCSPRSTRSTATTRRASCTCRTCSRS